MNPWDDIESIWEGWTKQFRCPIGAMQVVGIEPANGGDCATTYLCSRLDQWDRLRMQRVDQFIREHYPLPRGYSMLPHVYANNELGWTPDQFRDLDRRLEWEYQQAQFGRQIDAIPVNEAVKVE